MTKEVEPIMLRNRLIGTKRFRGYFMIIYDTILYFTTTNHDYNKRHDTGFTYAYDSSRTKIGSNQQEIGSVVPLREL